MNAGNSQSPSLPSPSLPSISSLGELPPLPALPLSTSLPLSADSPRRLSGSSKGSSSPLLLAQSSGKGARALSNASPVSPRSSMGFIRVSGSATPRLQPGTSTATTSTTQLASITTTTTTSTTTTLTTAISADADFELDFEYSTGSDADSNSGPSRRLSISNTPSRRVSRSGSAASSPNRSPGGSFSNTPEVGRKTPSPEKRMGPQTVENREKFDQLRAQARQRDDLLEALRSGNLEAVFTAQLALEGGEKGARKAWADHFPVADPEKLNGQMTAVVRQYVDRHGPHSELMAYAQWCDRHRLRMLVNDAELVRFPTLKDGVNREVRKLCLALRRLDETTDEATLKESVRSIKTRISAHETITALQLAHQTYASTRMMLQKTALLAEYCAGTTLDQFHDKLVEAHRMQENSMAELQTALRRVQPKWTRAIQLSEVALVGHCVNVYARGLTIPTEDLVPKAVVPAQLHVVLLMLYELISRPEGMHSVLEIAAMDYLCECICDRLDAWNRRLTGERSGVST